MKRIIIALSVFFVAAGMYWFFEIKKKSDDKIKKEKEEKVFPGLKSGDIKMISLKNGLTIEKQGDDYIILSPEKSFSDKYAVKAVFDKMADLRVYRKIEDFNPSDFGLDKPVSEIGITDAKGNTFTIMIGSLNPSGSYVYAMLKGQKAALMVDRSLADDAERKFDDLRFKGLLRTNEDEITRVRSTVEGKEFFAEKKNGRWVLASKGNAPVKWDRLKTAISSIKNSSAKKFLKLSGDYGFKKDKNYLYIEKGTETEMVFFGKHDKKNYSVYARNGNFNYAVEAPDYVFTNIPTGDDIINKQPLEFTPADVYGFKAEMPGKLFKAEKGRDGKWHVKETKGIKDMKAFDTASLVSAIYGIEYKKWHAASEGIGAGFFGNNMNNLKIELYGEKGKKIGSITFAEKPTGDVIYVRNDETMDVFEIERNAVSGMNMPGMEVPK